MASTGCCGFRPWRLFPFFSPSSTSRLIASGRLGKSACLRRQSSNSLAIWGCTRTPTRSPVTAPRFFGVFTLARVGPKTTDSPRPSLGSGAVGVYSTQSHWSQPGGGSDDREEDAGDDREEENEHCDGHAESEPSLGWPEGMAQGQGR